MEFVTGNKVKIVIDIKRNIAGIYCWREKNHLNYRLTYN